MKIQTIQPLNIFSEKDIFLTRHEVERILSRYIQVNTIPEYSREERAAYKKVADAAKDKLSHRTYPFKALAGDDEQVTVLGPVDRFEPYKTANKGGPENPKYLLVEDSQRKKSIRIATQLKDPDTMGYLIPRAPKPKSKRRLSTHFDKWLRKAQGRKPLEDMTRDEILKEVRQRIIDDFIIASEQIKNGNIRDYVLDRACDPLDPVNEVYRIIFEKYEHKFDQIQEMRDRKCCRAKSLNKAKQLTSDNSSLR